MIQTLFGSLEQEPSLLEKLKSGVQKTRAGLVTARGALPEAVREAVRVPVRWLGVTYAA